ncbi:Gliding motility regulatory protein [Rubripirellula lacrimiformis]|uniref:Gliding motility regulatory protein n=2 Tax=Rubripirellula lacrimiformis TaxID=1930273 RepID=A0A517N4I9_9BACT|nr:Gliding motility regulatory protein [Rubripirellula lacrimiformis]
MTLRSLVADDVRHNRTLAVHWLKELGHETFEAADGGEAWHIAKDKPLDLIVTDIEMPGRSGLDFLQQLRGHEISTIADVPVVVMSSLQDALLEKLALGFGATIVVRKPLSKLDFQKAVQRAMASPPSEGVSPEANSDHPSDDPGVGPISPTLRRIADRARRGL